MERESCQEYIRTHTRELEGLLKDIARIPAPTGQEQQRAAFCLAWLKNQGAENASVDEAGNVVYRYRSVSHDRGGRNRQYPVIVFMAHMDVVFPDLTELPLKEADGRIFCPGVEDNSANLAVLLMAAKYVIQHQPDTGERELLFVCGVGEEGLGNLKGAREICRRYGDWMEAFFAFDLTMESYTAKAVGSLRYRVNVASRGGHSYSCFGRTNANVVLAGLIQRLYQVQVPSRGRTTYNVGTISGGTSVNTIAQNATMLFEIRSDDREDLEEMKQTFEQILAACISSCPEDCKVSAEMIGERPCESGVDEEKRRRLFLAVESAVESACGIRPVPVSCSTDCNLPLSLGIPSVCVGTCFGKGAHTREEYVEKDSLGKGLAVALALVMNCCQK